MKLKKGGKLWHWPRLPICPPPPPLGRTPIHKVINWQPPRDDHRALLSWWFIRFLSPHRKYVDTAVRGISYDVWAAILCHLSPRKLTWGPGAREAAQHGAVRDEGDRGRLHRQGGGREGGRPRRGRASQKERPAEKEARQGADGPVQTPAPGSQRPRAQPDARLERGAGEPAQSCAVLLQNSKTVQDRDPETG